MIYSITKNNNTYTITNQDDEYLYVTVYVQESCESDEYEILYEEQSTLDTLTFVLPNKDNLYKFVLSDKKEDEEEVIIYYYDNLLNSLIEDIHYVLCGCKCKTCDDCSEETDYLSVITKILSYYMININAYNQNFLTTNSCIKCMLIDTNQCMLANELILGTTDNTLLMKQIIAYYYLVLYYTDLIENDNSESITLKYDYKNIIKCIKKLGIDESCIKDILISNNEK